MSATTNTPTPTTTTQTVPTPITDRAVTVAIGVAGLAEQAETIPIVKTTLERQFDSISHSSSFPLIASIAAVIGMALSQKGITVDTQLLTVAVGLALSGAGYVWQWAMIRWNKPVAVTTVAKAPTP